MRLGMDVRWIWRWIRRIKGNGRGGLEMGEFVASRALERELEGEGRGVQTVTYVV